MTQEDLPSHYYSFGQYVDRIRWLTYYAQLDQILAREHDKALEIGPGPGIVRSILSHYGCDITTLDVNDTLNPDIRADIRHFPDSVLASRWDWVLVCRVLHHIPLTEIPATLASLSKLDTRRLLVTVPREDLSIQVQARRTAGRSHHVRIGFSARLKQALRGTLIRSQPSGQWMIDGQSGPTHEAFRIQLRKQFFIRTEFTLHDDPSHVLFVLEPKVLHN